MGTLAASADRIDVEVRCQPVRMAPGLRVFEGGRSWKGYALADGDFALGFGFPEADTPLVYARFDPAVRRVQVTCAPGLRQDDQLPNPVRYPLDQLLTIHRLAHEGGAVVHCCAVAVDGSHVVLCPGVSGAGKTTLSEQLRDAPGLEVLSDDRAVVRRRGDGYVAWGTPWPGTGRHAVNRGLPLAAIAFVEKAPAAAAVPITMREAVLRLARVASVPWYDRDLGPRTFDGLAALCAEVPVFRLDSTREPAMAAVVRALAGAR